MLTAEEAKAVLVNTYNIVNADLDPNLRYGSRAFEKLVMREFNKAVVQKNAQFDYPIRVAAE